MARRRCAVTVLFTAQARPPPRPDTSFLRPTNHHDHRQNGVHRHQKGDKYTCFRVANRPPGLQRRRLTALGDPQARPSQRAGMPCACTVKIDTQRCLARVGRVKRRSAPLESVAGTTARASERCPDVPPCGAIALSTDHPLVGTAPHRSPSPPMK